MSLFRRISSPFPLCLYLCLNLSVLLLILMMAALPASLFAHGSVIDGSVTGASADGSAIVDSATGGSAIDGSATERTTSRAEPTDTVRETPICPADRKPTDPTLYEQLSDTLQLDEIVIRSTRLPAPLRYQPVAVRKLDSLTLGHLGHHAISELLSRYSALFIQDNGPGAMATLSQRGLSPSQTQVLWEGFPINSLSLGLTDLSLIPAAMTGSVEVSPGTPSSAFGGGSLGGIIFLSAPGEPERDGLRLYQTAGAFNSWSSGGSADISRNRWSLSLHALHHTADNDFRYFNRATLQTERRLNNDHQASHLQATFRYRPGRGRLQTTLWYADSDNRLPGSVLSSTPARQQDSSFRWTAGFERPYGEWNITARGFLEQTRFRFREPTAQTDSRFTMARRMVRLDLRRPGETVIWQGGLSGGYEMVDTNNYPGSPERLHAAATLNPLVRLSSTGLRLYPTLRLDGYLDYDWIVSPSLGFNQKLAGDELFLRGLVSRDFNPPTFNDLYWVPGGNPDLEPERSWRIETGLLYHPPSTVLESLEVTVYRIWLERGIYWFPGERGVWSPQNLDKVDARGVEIGAGLDWQLDRMTVTWRTEVDWRHASLAQARFLGDLAVGRQMRYVPEWTLRSHLHLNIDPVDLMLQARRTGERHVTEDHTTSLDPFWVLNATGAVQLPLFNQTWRLQLSLHNLLNQSYEIIQWYPMPGRYLEVSLALDLPF